MTTEIPPSRTDPRVEANRDAAWAVATRLYDAHPRDQLADALGRLNTLPDKTSSLDRQLVCAEYLAFVLGDTDFGAELAADIEHAAPSMLLGLDIDDYRPDPRTPSPDEDLDGYDWPAVAIDLAGLWERRAALIARQIVESHPAVPHAAA